MDAALSLFSARGYACVGLRDIARAAGVRESALYHYFPSKALLLGAVLEEDSGRFHQIERVVDAPAIAGEGVEAYLLAVVRTVLDAYSDPQELRLYRIMMHDGLRLDGDGLVDLGARVGVRAATYERLVRRLQAEGHVRPMPVEHAGSLFLGPLLLWRKLLLLAPDHPLVVEREAFARSHVELFLRAVGTAPPASSETSS